MYKINIRQTVAEVVPSLRLVQIKLRFNKVKICICLLLKFDFLDWMINRSEVGSKATQKLVPVSDSVSDSESMRDSVSDSIPDSVSVSDSILDSVLDSILDSISDSIPDLVSYSISDLVSDAIPHQGLHSNSN